VVGDSVGGAGGVGKISDGAVAWWRVPESASVDGVNVLGGQWSPVWRWTAVSVLRSRRVVRDPTI